MYLSCLYQDKFAISCCTHFHFFSSISKNRWLLSVSDDFRLWKSLIFGAKFKSWTPLKCVNFPTYLGRPIHTQTRCLSAQRVLCDGLRHGVAAVLGNHRAADGRQHVFGIFPLLAVAMSNFSWFGQNPKSPWHYFTSATLESLFLGLLWCISLDCTAPASLESGQGPLCVALYRIIHYCECLGQRP